MKKSNNYSFIKKLILSLNRYSIEGDFFKLETDFYDEFVEYDEDMNEIYEEYFSEICEKIDYTSIKEPTKEDKKYGWVNEKDFRVWLVDMLKDLPPLTREKN